MYFHHKRTAVYVLQSSAFQKGVGNNNINFMYDDSGLELNSYGVLYCNHLIEYLLLVRLTDTLRY